jgi:hypothetical protein
MFIWTGGFAGTASEPVDDDAWVRLDCCISSLLSNSGLKCKTFLSYWAPLLVSTIGIGLNGVDKLLRLLHKYGVTGANDTVGSLPLPASMLFSFVLQKMVMITESFVWNVPGDHQRSPERD